MRILLHTMATPGMDVPEALAFAQELKLDGIDLISQPGYRCSLDPDAPAERVQSIVAASAEHNMPILALTPYCKAINVQDEQVRSEAISSFQRAIEHAAAVGAENVRVLAGNEVPASEWDASLEILVDSLRSLGDFASKRGVAINIENHDGSMADDAARTAKIWRAVSHPSVGIIYDPANLVRDGKEVFPECVDLQAEGIRLIHVKDYVFSSTYATGRRAVPVGDGEIPWLETLRSLSQLGFDGDLSLEYETRWVPEELPDPAIGLARSRDFLRACLAELSVNN